jgi:hypothetical protein
MTHNRNNNNVDKVIRGMRNDKIVVTIDLVACKLVRRSDLWKICVPNAPIRMMKFWWAMQIPARSGERFILEHCCRGRWNGFHYCRRVH